MRDECLTLVITDLRTGSKEGQEDRQQNQSVENPQDGEDRQDSKEVSGKQKGSGTVSVKSKRSALQAPKCYSAPRAQLNNPTALKSQPQNCSSNSNTRLAWGFVLF